MGIVAVTAVGYWTLRTPATSAAVTAPIAATTSADAAPANSTEPVAQTSDAARAWDAAAAAQQAPAPVANRDTPVAENVATPSSLPPNASIEQMVDRVMPAVVLIEAGNSRGSGFFVAHDTLVTNVHVVENSTYVTLRRMDGSTMNAHVASKTPALDIAILKVSQPSSSQAVIPMGSAHSLKPGQEIVVIGSALGMLQNSVSRGVVSGLRMAGGATLVQTDAATNPGNSGGPMLDRNGMVVGITTMGYRDAQNLNFGVAIDHARDLLEGRQTSLGTTGGLREIQSRASASESDRQQQQGEQQFRERVRQMADAALRVDSGWRTFRSQCFKSPIPGNYDREWFAVLVPRALPGDAAAGCIEYFSVLESDIQKFKGLMRQTLDDARRANVLPGTTRNVLSSNRLSFDWER